MGNSSFLFNKKLGILRPAERLLATGEELCSMELDNIRHLSSFLAVLLHTYQRVHFMLFQLELNLLFKIIYCLYFRVRGRQM
jgi:hypothetical protein